MDNKEIKFKLLKLFLSNCVLFYILLIMFFEGAYPYYLKTNFLNNLYNLSHSSSIKHLEYVLLFAIFYLFRIDHLIENIKLKLLNVIGSSTLIGLFVLGVFNEVYVEQQNKDLFIDIIFPMWVFVFILVIFGYTLFALFTELFQKTKKHRQAQT